MQPVNIPGVGTVNFPDEMSDADIGHVIENQIIPQHAAEQKAHEKKTGTMAAVKSGFHESLGAAEQALGEVSGSQKLQDWAKENALKAQTEHEATTSADVENAKGFFNTAGKMFSKNIGEPLGGILGSYGAPLALGVAGTIVAPEALVGAGGAAALEGLTGEELLTATAAQAAKQQAAKQLVGQVATTAAAAPAEMGRNLQQQEAAHPGAAHDLTTAALASIPEAALVGFGMPGTKAINRLVPELLPVAETLVPKIESGAMTAAEAQKELAGKIPQYLKAMAANTAAGTGMMVGTEDIRRAQAGQDLMSGAEMAQTAKTAGLLSPIFAAFHGSDRAAAHDILTNAQRERDVKQEQTQLDTHGGTEAEVASADAERAADLAGLKRINDEYLPIQKEAARNKDNLEKVIYPQLRKELNARRENAFEAVPKEKDLGTQEGVKEAIANLQKNPNISDEAKKSVQIDLNQQLKTLKQRDAAYKTLPPTEKEMAMKFDAHDAIRSVTGIDDLDLHTALETKVPLAQLYNMRDSIQDSSLSKAEQPKVEYMTSLFDAAIKNHPDTLKASLKEHQQSVFEQINKRVQDNQTKEDALKAKSINANIAQWERDQAKAEADRLASDKQEALAALAAGPEARDAYLAKQAAAVKTELPAEAFPGDSTSDTRTDAERQAQIVQSTARARTASKAEQDRADAEAAAAEAKYKQEHQAAAVEDFGLQRQKPSEEAPSLGEPAAGESALTTQLRKEQAEKQAITPAIEEPIAKQPKGQGELFTPKTGEPTKAARVAEPKIEPTTAARTAEEKFTKRDTTPKKGSAGRTEPEIKAEHVELKPAIDEVHKAARDAINLAAENKIKLPEVLATLLKELQQNHAKTKEEFADWKAQSDILIKNTRDFIRTKVNEKVGKGVAERLSREQSSKELASQFGFGERPEDGWESRGERKEPKEPKTVAKEATTKEALHQAVKDWFNPVWLNRAIKNGWLHIEDSIQDTDLDQGTKDKFDQSKGIYFGKDGSVYLFAKNIPAGNELGVILHEIGEHKGLDNMIGKDRVTQLANRVRDMANGKKGTLDQKIAAKALARIEGMKGDKADKELIAYFTEIAVNEHDMKPNGKANLESKGTLDWINTLWNSISKALEKLHFSPKDFNAQDLLNVVHGAARLEMGDIGKGTVGEERVMESSNKPQMTAAEEKDRKARGLTVFAPDPKKGPVENIKTMYKTVGMMRDKLDTLGVQMVGPLFSAHRKANEYYGPESFYTKTTNKIRGTLLMQHTLNAMNFIIPSMRNGSLTIDAKGYFHQVIDKNNNIPELAKKYDAIQKAMKANGVSDAIIEQDIKTMVFADRYKSLKDKGIKTPGEFTDASYKLGKELQLKYAKEYKEWRDMYNNIRNNKRELLVKSGLMTSKKVDEFLDRLEYLPLYRMSENEAMDAVFMSSLTAATREQRLKFDTEAFAVGDPMDNIMKNEMWLYQRAMRNHTANRMADEFSEMGLGRFVKNRQANDKNVVTILKDGELAHFQVDNPNDAAVFQAAPTAHGATIGVMRIGASLLRRGVTITPSFAYRQMFDDVERTYMQSGGERSFLGTLMKSATEQGKNLRSDTKLTKELEAHGVVGQVDIQDGFNRMMQHMMGTHNDTWLGKAESVLEGAERVARNSDMAARLSVYDSVIAQAKKEGRTDTAVIEKEAALRAQMMINFNHKGTSGVIRTLTAMVPFINARIQSDWRLLDAVKGNIPGVSKEKAHKMLMFKVAKMATFTALYAMARSGDDDYEDSSEETRNRNFLFDIGGASLKIPVAPEYALLKGATEHTYRMLTDQEFEDSAKMRHAIATGIGNLIVSPTDVMPSMIRPFLENVTNHSFFNDRALVSPTLLGRDVNKQYVEGQTSELAIYLSDVGQSMFGNEFNTSPIKIDNVLRGMFGTMGSDVAFTSNLISNWASESERPTSKLNQIPEIGALFYDPNGSQRKNDFYTLRDKVVSAHNTLLELRKSNPPEAAKYMEDNADILRLDGQINAITNQFAQIRKQKQSILSKPLSEMDGDQKREAIDALADREKKLLGTRVQEMNKHLKEAQE